MNEVNGSIFDVDLVLFLLIWRMLVIIYVRFGDRSKNKLVIRLQRRVAYECVR